MNNQQQYDDSQWRNKLQLAHKIFNKGDKALSIQHYQVVIGMANQLFNEYKNMKPLPEELTPALVVSYLNLADCWAALHNKKEQILCLTEIYDYLKTILSDSSASPALVKQAYEGVSNLFIELCTCFRDMNARRELKEMEVGFSELSITYQTQFFQHLPVTLH